MMKNSVEFFSLKKTSVFFMRTLMKLKLGLIIIGVFIFAIFPMTMDVLITKIKGWMNNDVQS